MKIIVSKKAIKNAMHAQINSTVYMAKSCASRGITSFYVTLPDSCGYNKYDFIKEVEKATEKTVFAGARSVSGDSIRFSIAQEDRIYG